jgi:hypothetical protein
MIMGIFDFLLRRFYRDATTLRKNRRFHQKRPVNRVLQFAVPSAANTKMKSGKLLPVPPSTFVMSASIFVTISFMKKLIVKKTQSQLHRNRHKNQAGGCLVFMLWGAAERIGVDPSAREGAILPFMCGQHVGVHDATIGDEAST